MAYTNSTSAHGTGIAAVATYFVESLKQRYKRNRVYRETLNELRGLSDRDLADLGVARANIPHIAWDAALQATR